MRLYLNNLIPSDIKIDTLIKSMSKELTLKKTTCTYVLSESGIFKLLDNTLQHIHYIDGNIEIIYIDGEMAIIDNGVITTGAYTSQIPIENFEYESTIYQFTLNKNDQTKFIAEISNDICFDCYFETISQPISQFTHDIISLSTTLNFC